MVPQKRCWVVPWPGSLCMTTSPNVPTGPIIDTKYCERSKDRSNFMPLGNPTHALLTRPPGRLSNPVTRVEYLCWNPASCLITYFWVSPAEPMTHVFWAVPAHLVWSEKKVFVRRGAEKEISQLAREYDDLVATCRFPQWIETRDF